MACVASSITIVSSILNPSFSKTFMNPVPSVLVKLKLVDVYKLVNIESILFNFKDFSINDLDVAVNKTTFPYFFILSYSSKSGSGFLSFFSIFPSNKSGIKNLLIFPTFLLLKI